VSRDCSHADARSRANHAAAFERISRPNLSWRFSRRRRLSSSRSTVVKSSSRRPSSRSSARPSCGSPEPMVRTPSPVPPERRPVRTNSTCHCGLRKLKRSGVHESGATSAGFSDAYSISPSAWRLWAKVAEVSLQSPGCLRKVVRSGPGHMLFLGKAVTH
jgi:hypothetical protein